VLYLKQDFSNVVLMSLLDRTTNSITGTINWSYLFSFKNDMTKESFTMINYLGGDMSTIDGSNNLIVKIKDIQTGFFSPLKGEIKLYPKGFWSYDVYEQKSLTNLDITDTSIIAKIETGKAYIYDNTEEVKYTEHTDTTDTTNYMYIK
tara:strand:- start:1679 stop:2122 length:444 start_codon:yes stop_codon:yes gene_type:complete